MRQLVVAWALALALGAVACAKVPEGTGPAVVPSPEPSGFVAVPVDDARLRTAVDKGVAQLRGTDWLGWADLAAGPITAGERWSVMGTHHRATLELVRGATRRAARLQVVEDVVGRFQVLAVDLGPAGGTAPLPDTPDPAAMPGGWADQPPADPAVRQAAEQVRGLMASEAWLGRPVALDRVVAARTQVVAGLNTYVALDVRVDGFAHGAEAIMYAPLEGAASLAWLRLVAPSPMGGGWGAPPMGGRGGRMPMW